MVTRFSNETEYTFDCAVESGELTLDVPLFLRCFYPGDAVIENLNSLRPQELMADDRAGSVEGITAYLTRRITERCDELRAREDYDRELWSEILLQAIMCLSMQGREMGNTVAADLAMAVTGWGTYAPGKRAIRRSNSAAFQRQFIRGHGMTRVFMQRAKRLLRLMRSEIKRKFTVNLEAPFLGPQTHISFDRLNARIDAYHRLPPPDRPRGVAKAPSPEQRKALRRAMKLATQIVGENAVYDFLRGKPVYVIGRDFVYRAEMINPFIIGHGSTKISVCDHDLNPLADLCVFFRSSPALDHLAALKLHCDSGHDADILYDANVTAVYPHAENHVAFKTVRETKKDDARTNARLRNLENAVLEGVNADESQIRLWAETVPTITINSVAVHNSTVSFSTRTNAIIRGTNYVVSNIASNASTTNVPTISGDSFFNISMSGTSTTITWQMREPSPAELEEQNRNASRYMQFHRQKLHATEQKRNKKKWWDRKANAILLSRREPVDKLAFERWSENYGRDPKLRDQISDLLFTDISRGPKLGRLLASIGKNRVQQHEDDLRDMARNDDGTLPEDHGPSLSSVRQSAMDLTSRATARLIRQVEENGDAAGEQGENFSALARDVVTRQFESMLV